MSLSTREIATAIWLAVFLVWAVSHPSIRPSLKGLVAAAFHWKIVILVGVMALYTGAVVMLLSSLEIWQPALLKETVIWFILSGVALLVASFTRPASDGFLGRVVRDSLKVVVVFEFLAGTYTFPLVAELILLPLLAFWAAVDAYASTKDEYAGVAKVTSAVLVIVSLAIVVSAIWRAAHDLRELATLDSLRQIALGPLLSLASVPLLLGFMLFSRYEMLFIRVGPVRETLPLGIRWYARYRLFRLLGFQPARIDGFLRQRGVGLMRIRSKEDVDELVSQWD